MQIPNFRNLAHTSPNRSAFSAGVGHLLAQINLPSIAWRQPWNYAATAFRWGVPWAVDPERVCTADLIARKFRDRRSRTAFPAFDREAVVWFDDIGKFNLPAQTVEANAVFSCEVARCDSQSYGMVVVQRLATWARVQAIDADGNPDGNSIDLAETFNNDAPTLGRAFGSPFPFPLVHPSDPSRSLTIEWRLVYQDVPSLSTSVPVILPPGAGTQRVPAARTWKAWDDMRYGYGSRYTTGMQIQYTGHGIWRLFAIAKVAGLTEVGGLGFSVQVGGRLAGFTQLGGDYSRARLDATRRL